MKCILSRKYESDRTMGGLFVMDGFNIVYKCKTLELKENGNQHNTSCIPEGTYDVVSYDSPTKGNCFHVLNVPDRDSILIHKGNFTKDTLGCILVGSGFVDIDADGTLDVIESTKTLTKLLSILPENFKLTIM